MLNKLCIYYTVCKTGIKAIFVYRNDNVKPNICNKSNKMSQLMQDIQKQYCSYVWCWNSS